MRQGGVRLCRAMLISVAALGFFVRGFYFVQAVSPSELVISKIQITGGVGLTAQDFISIYNRSTEPIDLNGLRLVKRTKTGTSDTTLKSWSSPTLVNPGAYYTWANSDYAAMINAEASSSQTISNDNGAALREGPENTGVIIDSVGWGEAANIFVEGSAFATNPPGGKYIERKNNLDSNNNATDFQLYPPDEPEPEPEEEVDETEETNEETETPKTPSGSTKDLVIHEIFINPKEVDNLAPISEFVELHNKGTGTISLDGWRIEVGESLFELSAGTTLGPNSFTLIQDPKNLPLPNNGASVKLFAPGRTTATQTVSYKKAEDGMSYAYFASGWRWTVVPTPARENILAQPPRPSFETLNELLVNIPIRFDSSDTFTNNKNAAYIWDFGDGQTSALAYPEHVFSKAGKYKVVLQVSTEYGAAKFDKTITIQNLSASVSNESEKDEPTDTVSEKTEKTSIPKTDELFTTAGTAIVAPGIFGTQYFYFLPEHGEPLYEVYNSKKLFPKIQAGDQLIVTGEYSETEKGPRLKTKEAKDIQLIGNTEVPLPQAITSAEFKLAPFPRLALIEGEVVSKKSPRVILTDAQGEMEIYLSSNSKLKVSDFTVGDKISVFGVLENSAGTPRLRPRGKEDISKLAKIIEAPENSIAFADTSIVSATAITEEFIEERPTSRKEKLFIYLLATAILAIGVAIFIIYRKKDK